MLTKEQNDILTRVEGEVPMGQLMRRHWLPACPVDEVSEPDGAPVRTRMLGENLVIFRDTSGQLGALDEMCPHRKALEMSLSWLEICGRRYCFGDAF